MTGSSGSKETCSFKVQRLEFRHHSDELTSHQRLSFSAMFGQYFVVAMLTVFPGRPPVNASVCAAFRNLTRITAFEGGLGPVLLIHCRDS